MQKCEWVCYLLTLSCKHTIETPTNHCSVAAEARGANKAWERLHQRLQGPSECSIATPTPALHDTKRKRLEELRRQRATVINQSHTDTEAIVASLNATIAATDGQLAVATARDSHPASHALRPPRLNLC
jgi:hypothetical protein